jgi:hypothetical protein
VGGTNSNPGNRKASEASASFLKKEAKNFYLLSSRLPVAYTIVLARHAVGNSEPSVIFFCLFSRKKRFDGVKLYLPEPRILGLLSKMIHGQAQKLLMVSRWIASPSGSR